MIAAEDTAALRSGAVDSGAAADVDLPHRVLGLRSGGGRERRLGLRAAAAAAAQCAFFSEAAAAGAANSPRPSWP